MVWYVHRKRETRFPDGHLGFPVLLDSERKRTQSTTRDVTPLISIIKAAKLFFVLLARAPPFSHIFTLKGKHSAVIIGNSKVPSETFLSNETNPSVAIYIHGCGLTQNESVGSYPDLFGSWATMTLYYAVKISTWSKSISKNVSKTSFSLSFSGQWLVTWAWFWNSLVVSSYCHTASNRAPNWEKMKQWDNNMQSFFLRTLLHPLLLAMQLHEIDSLAYLPRVRNAKLQKLVAVANSSCVASQHLTASSEKDLPIVTTNIALALATFRRPDTSKSRHFAPSAQNCLIMIFIIQIASKGRYQVLPFRINRIIRNQMLERIQNPYQHIQK